MNPLNPHRDRSPTSWIRSRLPFMLPALTACAIVIGCDGAPPAGDTGAPTDTADQPLDAAAAEMPLVSADALLDQVNTLVKDPERDPLPEDSMLAEQIRLG
ncbi:MAG TPA: hypothetical protein VK966_07880, partial [Longimicrobiales bacterium]|nr:hypothetical protein [Longimicrobiales bacterium]